MVVHGIGAGMAGSVVMRVADASRVPTRGALAVDRDQFSAHVTETLTKEPGIEIVRYGVMHRNTYLNAPRRIHAILQLCENPWVFIAGANSDNIQPMNANWGLVPQLAGRFPKPERRAAMYQRGLEAFASFQKGEFHVSVA